MDEERAAARVRAPRSPTTSPTTSRAPTRVARRPARPLRGGDARGARPARARPRHRPAGRCSTRSSSRPSRTRARALRELRAAGHAPRGGEQLGLLAAGVARRPPGCSSSWTAWSSSAEVGAAKPDPGAVPPRRSSWPASSAGEALHVGDSLENDVEGARAAGVRAVLVDRATGAAAAGRGVGALARRGPLPTLRADGSRGHTQSRPTRPSCRRAPRRAGRAWYAGVGFLVAITATLVAVGIVAAIAGVTPTRTTPPSRSIATLAQSAIFVGTAVLFASFTRKPKALAFRAAPDAASGRRVGWAALGLFTFYVLGRDLLGDRPARRRADGGRGPRQRPGHVRPDRGRLHDRLRGARRPRSSSSAASSTGRCAPATRCWRGGDRRRLLFGLIHFDFSGADAPADPAAARAARLHLLPGLREDRARSSR